MDFNITQPNTSFSTALIDKINNKTKPFGSLGLLEDIALQIGLIQGSLNPALCKPTMLVFAADHGIANAGVSAYPQGVTAQMVSNFVQQGAAINVFTAQHGIHLKIIDSGVNATLPQSENLIDKKIAYGTQNFLTAPAMSIDQCKTAIQIGTQIAEMELATGCNIIGFGEMGIGNTASASCLMARLCNLPIEDCVGRGTGLDDAGLNRKIAILKEALAMHPPYSNDATVTLATFGGFETAMMVGAMLRAAEKHCILLIDGFISSAALLVAYKICPEILHYCIFSHCSDELGHKKMLAHFNAKPLLSLGLRLGEGSGAALAFPLIVSAVNFLNNMASFESAKVSTTCQSA